MSISKVALGLVLAGVFAAITNCSFGDECLRYSDCEPGLTCAAGHCVVAGEGDPTTAASTVGDASVSPPSEASAPTSPESDAGTSDASSDDAGDAADADVDSGT